MTAEARGEYPQPEKIDSEITPERESLNLVKILVISGRSHTGKDITAEILHDNYGWPVEDGKSIFERRTGVETGHILRDPLIHKRFDRFQAKFFRTATPADATIWQTRLGGIILAEERDRRAKEIQKVQWAKQLGAEVHVPGLIPAVSVLIWARKEVRIDRAYGYAIKNWEEQMANPIEGSELPEKPTKSEIESKLDQRSRGDILDWMSLHPKYLRNGRDPFDRKLSRENGGPVYDIFIDTSDKTPEEVVAYLVNEAKKLGAVEEKNSEEVIYNGSEINNPILGEPLSAGQ
jgi:cytidylate kinase